MEFITFLSINPSLPAAQKYRLWMSPAIRDCIEIESDEQNAAEATMRAIRLFSGDLILIRDHATVPASTALRSSVAMRLGLRLIPVLQRPFDAPVDTPVRPILSIHRPIGY